MPDTERLDTNCDGIDGTAASSVFVSPYGLDSSAGTKDDPVKTIGKAVRIAQASNGKLKDVLVCVAKYAENVAVSGTGVGLHGGYDCTSWKRTIAHSQIAPSAGVVLRVSGVTGMALSKLDFVSADATGAGESSQAAQIIESTQVHIEETNIAAGRGGPGVNAVQQTQTWNGTKPPKAAAGESVEVGTDGSLGCHTAEGRDLDFDGQIDSAGDATLSRCTKPKSGGDGAAINCRNAPGVSIRGGKGGSAALKPLGLAPIGNTIGQAGTPVSATTASNAGTPGASFGAISKEGYLATNQGGDGGNGQPGTSGMGGLGGGSCLVRWSNNEMTDVLVAGTTETRAGFTCMASVAWGTAPWNDAAVMGTGRVVSMFPGSGGGQGGCGGCGGFGGFGGGAGGGSIGLVVFSSEVTLSKCNITANAGGAGGFSSDGTAGQAGGEGGDGGAVIQSGVKLPFVNAASLFAESQLKGWSGTSGSQGQKGGAGGPGGGGPSIAILWTGTTKPAYDATVTATASTGGKGGVSAGGSGSPAADGLSGDVVNAADL